MAVWAIFFLIQNMLIQTLYLATLTMQIDSERLFTSARKPILPFYSLSCLISEFLYLKKN